MSEGLELEVHDPFVLPDEHELEHEVLRPRWWYAQQLHMAGASWEEVAKALGYTSGDSASQSVRSAKRKRTKEELEDIVDLELDRLDALQLAHWRLAVHGDKDATKVILGIMQLRMKLAGTEKKPETHESSVTNAAIFIGGDEASYTKALKDARDMVFNKQIEG